MRKILFVLGITTCLATAAHASLTEGILAYQYKQYPAALSEFTYLAEEGNPIASYYLGKIYQEGLGTPKNLVRAYNLFSAANAGYYFPATAELGKMLLEGSPQLPADVQQALVLLKKAANAGESDATYELGRAYALGIGVEANLNYAYGYYLIAALKGHMKAQYALANLYLEGRGIPQNYASALKWLTRSARQGYVLAQVELADIRTTNKRLKNLGEAYGWYSIIAAHNSDIVGKKAIESRDYLAGQLESNVLKEQQDQTDSWKPISAEKSVPQEEKEKTPIPTIPDFNDAQYVQDLLIAEGFLPRDGALFGITVQMIDTAVATQEVTPLTSAIENAARNGKKTAYGYYADLYKTRLNNLEEAFAWYKKGAEAGDAYAAYQLAKMFCEGKTLAQPDAVACYAWLKIAQEEQNPILNGLIQNSLALVRSSATKEELQAGETMFEMLQKTTEEKEEKSGGFDFL